MRTLLIYALACVLAAAPKAGEPAPVRDDLNALAVIEGFPKQTAVFANRSGFCLDLGCGDGRLAVELAQKTKHAIFAIAKDDADCDRTRQALDKANLYGTRATAMTGSLQKLPFPQGYGNLIVTGDYSEALDLKEVLRVLSPNGVAIIGGGKADAGKLKAALEAAAIQKYTLDGTFAIIPGQMPAGVHDWTHFTPQPDNLNTSRETLVRPPFRSQWFVSEPRIARMGVTHAAIAHGRTIYRNGPDYYAWDCFNGQLLWERRTKAINGYRHALIDGIFYSIESDAVLALDAATGAVLREFRFTDSKWPAKWTCSMVYRYEQRLQESQARDVQGAYWCWLAVENGTLYALAQTPTEAKFRQCTGNLFVAYDLKSGEMLWKREFKAPVMGATTALGGGRLYCCTIEQEKFTDKGGPGRLYALDPKTGEDLWQIDPGKVCAPPISDIAMAAFVDGRYFTWGCLDEQNALIIKAFDAATGNFFREYNVRARGTGDIAPPLFVNGRIYTNQGVTVPERTTAAGYFRSDREYSCVDVATGEKQETGLAQGWKRGCGPGSASANCFFSGGQNFSATDLLTGKTWWNQYFRTPCTSGPLSANGLLHNFLSYCQCIYARAAPLALAPAGLDWTPPAADKDLPARVVAGPAFDAPLVEDEKDNWSHYRGNPGHTGATATTPAMPLAPRWERQLGGPLTPPSFGAGLAYVGSRQGVVWALDQRNGETRWKFLCGAGVRVAPAYAQGRVLFGSNDGWVYCVDAKSGQLAWRFRAAPEDYFINAQGQLNSIWPSSAGVVVENGVAYCAAGLTPYDGTYLYALDLKTGKPAWAKKIGDGDQLHGAPEGIIALANDTLIVPDYMRGHNQPVLQNGGNQAYRKQDGERIAWYPPHVRTSGFPLGSEAVADGDVFFYGGARYGETGYPGGPFTLMDAKTGLPYRSREKGGSGVAAIAPLNVAPVLGSKIIVGDGDGYDREQFCKTMLNDPSQIKEAITWTVPLWPAPPAPAPKKPVSQTTGLALAGDVVLASGAAKVVAFEAKAAGKELSRVKLKGKILRNTLAVAGGRVFVVTDEGSVHCLGKE